MSPPVPPDVLSRWRALAGRPCRPFGNGLINDTFLVEGADGKAVLQRLHPVFGGVVNEDIDAVTTHLAARGLATPHLLRTDDRALWAVDADGLPWRAQSFVEGTSLDRVTDPAVASDAAGLLARFHRAVSDLDWSYRHVRPNIHDTPRHLEALRQAVENHPSHRLYEEVVAIAGPMLERARHLRGFNELPLRHVHGDPKISNVLFDAGGKALCLVDLDTVGLMAWPLELGDALRSWCNPAGEDADGNALDLALFRATVDGYAAVGKDFVTPAEVSRLVDGLATICLELSARFLADALNEKYFGWDSSRHATRGDHNLLRARGQWSLYRSVESRRPQLEAIVQEAFAR